MAVGLIGSWKVNAGSTDLLIKALAIIDARTTLGKIV
jgi:hypothetical protein